MNKKKSMPLDPGLISEWDYDKNDGLMPSELTPVSRRRVWWKCSKGHSWQASPYSRSRGAGCPYCDNKKLLIGFNDLASKNPELVKEWDYDKNDGLSPEQCIYVSSRDVWWKCSKGHSWKISASERTRLGKGCPYCAGHKVKSGENDLLTLYPDIASEWDYEKNGELRPEHVTPGSGRKVWWLCSEGHSWQAIINNRKKTGCPMCSGRKIIPGKNDLKTVKPRLAEEWDYEKNGDLRPEEVNPQSGRAVWWKCAEGHSWKARVYHRYRGTGCPKCEGIVKMRTYFM